MCYIALMLRIVALADPAREAVERTLLSRMSLVPAEVASSVRQIIDDVQRRGDAAVRELTARFDRRELTALELDGDEWSRQAEQVAQPVRDAIDRARDRITRFAEPQRRDGYTLSEPRHRLEPARAAARARRALCAGRNRALSVVGADDGGAGAAWPACARS